MNHRFAAVPRLALSYTEAAESLGVSRDHFERHVLPHLRIVPCGRRRLVPMTELHRYAESQGSLGAA